MVDWNRKDIKQKTSEAERLLQICGNKAFLAIILFLPATWNEYIFKLICTKAKTASWKKRVVTFCVVPQLK